MRFLPPPWRVALLSVMAVVLLGGCSLLTRFSDCQASSDCPTGQVCNLRRHYCQIDTAEVCGNGRDDDQDGLADSDDDFGPCQVDSWRPGMGCRDGNLRCAANALACVQRTAASTEECSNGIDDDCNGIVDDSAACLQNFPAVTASAPMRIGSNDPTFGEGDDSPEHSICLASFQIDRFEVSTGAYLRYLNSLPAGAVTDAMPDPQNPTLLREHYLMINGRASVLLPTTNPHNLNIEHSPSAGWRPTDPDPTARQLPMVNVTWYGADSYCRWAGKHLPSEAEWWRAARGPDGLRPFPWGTDEPACDRANTGVGGTMDGGACVGRTMNVNSLPMGRTPEGVFHLFGNANEWVYDWLNDTIDHSRNNYYADPPDAGWCATYPEGPLGPDGGRALAQPGGDGGLYCRECKFARGRHYGTIDRRIGIRRWLDPDRADNTVGFRCSAGGARR